jgi:hypothetical protein
MDAFVSAGARAYFVAVPFLSFSIGFMIVYVYCMKHRSAIEYPE